MIKKIKDIVYDVNDIIVVLIIIALAALVVWGRLEAILAYPVTGDTGFFVSQGDKNREDPGNIAGNDNDAAATTGGSIIAAGDGDADNPEEAGLQDGGVDTYQGTDPGTGQPDTVPPSAADQGQPSAEEEYPFSMYVAYGDTASKIADKLLEGGIIADKNDFYDALIAAKADTKLLAGSFIIPKGSSAADVVRILTGG